MNTSYFVFDFFQIRFFYHMYGGWYSMGTLAVKLLNTVTGDSVDLWRMSGNRGRRWLKAEVDIVTNWPVAQVEGTCNSDQPYSAWAF